MRKQVIKIAFGSTALALSLSFSFQNAYGAVSSLNSIADFDSIGSPIAPSFMSKTIAPSINQDLLNSYVDLDGNHKLRGGNLDSSILFVDAEDYKVPKSPIADKTVASFSMDEVLRATTMVEASCEFALYSDTLPFAEKLQREGSRVEYFGRNDKDGGIFVTHKDGTAHLVYRGSSNLDNWVQNANILNETEDDGGRYHRGFYKGYDKTSDQVWAMIDAFAQYQGLTRAQALGKITVTGYSRGGAIATIFSDVARRKTGFAPRTVTFEAPRALHKYTAAEYNVAAKSKTLNIAQKHDPVHYANFSAFAGDAHVGQKMYLPLDKNHFPHVLRGFSNALHAMEQVGKLKGSNGRIYEFEAYKEDRDHSKEKDHSVQAYVESAIGAVRSVYNGISSAESSAWGAVKS